MYPNERDYYMPPDICVNENGTLDQQYWPNVLRFRNDRTKFLTSFTGMGMPPIAYIKQSGPEQHGSTILDFRLQERLIQYTIYHKAGCERQDYWDGRGNLVDILRPNRQAVDSMNLGRLRKVMPNGTTRDIDALINDGPAFSTRNPDVWQGTAITETLRFICPDPTWYDPVTRTITWTVETISGLLFYSVNEPDHLVLPDNMIFASDVLEANEVIVTYPGTWFGYPTIIITGPITGPTIENQELGTKISLDYEVDVGEVVTIVTAYGRKSIINHIGTNLYGTLTADSDMNFYLAPNPTVANGVNTLVASGSNADEAQTSIVLKYNPRYIGI